jgi:inner membrane protein
MDSLTQLVLGSAVGVAVLGRRTAIWKAATWGAVAGTLPDLDAFIDQGDAILNMTRHRAETHSLVYLTLAAPVFAWLAAWLLGWRQALQAPRQGLLDRLAPPLLPRWWLATWLIFITHTAIDAMTVYGTQLWLPFTSHPYGVGSIFIIDPAYTLPLLFGLLVVLLRKGHAGLRWNVAGLVLSTAYMGWSVVAQQHVTRVVNASLQAQGIAAERVLVTPAPFNTVLWRVVVMTPTQYLEGFHSLLDAPQPRPGPQTENPTASGSPSPARHLIAWRAYDRGAEWLATHAGNPGVARIAAFSHGFYRLSAGGENQDRLQITDLRMGQEPFYTFRFDVGPTDPAAAQDYRPLGPDEPQQPPSVLLRQRPDIATALPWLWERLKGNQNALAPWLQGQ